MGAVTIRTDAELERAWDVWVLVRRSLGIEAFGVNIVELPEGGSIPEHDEVERDQEEVFLVLSGSPTLVVDGVDHVLAPGTFARLDPAPRRTVRNDAAEPARVLIVSAPRTSGYQAMDWA
jgi:(S)-ureidoglycine aminohydrolase